MDEVEVEVDEEDGTISEGLLKGKRIRWGCAINSKNYYVCLCSSRIDLP